MQVPGARVVWALHLDGLAQRGTEERIAWCRDEGVARSGGRWPAEKGWSSQLLLPFVWRTITAASPGLFHRELGRFV